METLDNHYFEWLYVQVDIHQRSNYTKLLRALFETEFFWDIEFDRNRAEDGKGLRRDFSLEEMESGLPREWMEQECSLLEMLIALARRMALLLDGKTSSFFWRMVENSGLSDFDDDNFDEEAYEELVDTLNNREYNYDGTGGGLFPLSDPANDQRNVELLYQMYAYVQAFY